MSTPSSYREIGFLVAQISLRGGRRGEKLTGVKVPIGIGV